MAPYCIGLVAARSVDDVASTYGVVWQSHNLTEDTFSHLRSKVSGSGEHYRCSLPATRPIANIAPVIMVEAADGSTTLIIVWRLVAPSIGSIAEILRHS